MADTDNRTETEPRIVTRVMVLADRPRHRQALLGAADGARHLDIDVSPFSSLGAALAALPAMVDEIDGIIVSTDLPDANPQAAVAQLVDRLPTVPVVVVADQPDHRLETYLLTVGADEVLDFATLDWARFERTLEHALVRHRQLARAQEAGTAVARADAERRWAELSLDHLASHDPLTGLANRLTLEEAITRAIDRPASVTVMVVDLANFGRINEVHGHHAGDALLIEASLRLRDAAPAHAEVARVGGDSFAVLWPGLRRSQTRAAAETLLARLGAPWQHGGVTIEATAYVGVAHDDAGTATADVLLSEAANAVKASKERGRNTITAFHDELHAVTARNLHLEALLRAALRESNHIVEFQPIVSLSDGRLCGGEALMRLRDDDGSIIGPAEFIPVAEDCGLISALGERALGEAAQWAHRWQSVSTCHPIHISANLSAQQLMSPGMIELARAMARDRVPITLEITETALAQSNDDSDDAATRLQSLAELGYRIGLDDFGTGWSSLTWLWQYPVEFIKIDKSFVAEIHRDDQAYAIVRGLVLMAGSLGLEVIAEGIESTLRAELLRDLGCNRGQGYLFSRSLPPAQFEEMLRLDEPLWHHRSLP